MTDEKQNTVPESIEIPHEINSISDLSRILQTLGEPKKGHTRFFRGHGDKDWQMLPSIYREDYLIENEDKIIKDALTYCPDDFLPSDTLFEKLVKLQHYGYSTRLLDLTTNALVALYFALGDKKHYKKDGEIIILDIPNEQVKYWDSDTVAILSAISLRKKEFNLIKIMNDVSTSSTRDIIKMTLKEARENSELEKIISSLSQNPLFESLRIENKDSDGTKLFISIFNKEVEIASIIHDIHADKPSFRPIIRPEDFQHVLCVRAKLNNQRISRQQGCFLLFGIKGSKTEAAAISTEWHPSALNNQKILVKAESKAVIKQELESFGISKRTLFPELEAQATEIMNHYKGQK